VHPFSSAEDTLSLPIEPPVSDIIEDAGRARKQCARVLLWIETLEIADKHGPECLPGTSDATRRDRKIMTFGPLMRLWHISILAALALPACGDDDSTNPDTCSDGDNMGNPRVADGFDPADLEPELRVVWDRGSGRGAELPDHYFAEVELSAGTGSEIRALVQSVEHSAAREITVRFDAQALATLLQRQNQLVISLAFPDRRTVIDCRHPGMADMYLLDVLLVFESGELSRSQATQRKNLGAI
jgi:hypothetical protein